MSLIIRHDHKNESWPDIIWWPIVKRVLEKGYRSGSTRIYTLQCGHSHRTPAARWCGRGKIAHCVTCTFLWRWMTQAKCGLIVYEKDIKALNPAALAEMLVEARRLGKLARQAYEALPDGQQVSQ